MTQLATPAAYGTLSDDATLTLERLLPGSIDRVWAYLTDSDKRARWLASGPMELRPGGDTGDFVVGGRTGRTAWHGNAGAWQHRRRGGSRGR